MELRAEWVNHKSFGRGQIIDFKNNCVTVMFNDGNKEKKFSYPFVFGLFLELENKSFYEQINQDKDIATQKENELRRIKNELDRIESARRLEEAKERHFKNKPKGWELKNIAFRCNYCDGGRSNTHVGFKGVCSDEVMKHNINVAKGLWCGAQDSRCKTYLNGEIPRNELEDFCENNGFVCYESQMLSLWKAYAGVTQNGERKLPPMTLRNIESNSLTLLTSRLPNAKDEERFIFAVFLINKDFDENKGEGNLEADQKYKIQLSPDEAKELRFWDYYSNPTNPEKALFGSGTHKFFTDIQAAQVLKKICELKKGTPDEELAKEFFDYYCEIKKLEIGFVPDMNGALIRISRNEKISS